jgi:hypothetical protein
LATPHVPKLAKVWQRRMFQFCKNLATPHVRQTFGRPVVEVPETGSLNKTLFLNRVARLYFFKQKIPFWVYLGWPWNEICWYILRLFGIFDSHLSYGNLVHFVVTRCTFFPTFGMLN